MKKVLSCLFTLSTAVALIGQGGLAYKEPPKEIEIGKEEDGDDDKGKWQTLTKTFHPPKEDHENGRHKSQRAAAEKAGCRIGKFTQL